MHLYSKKKIVIRIFSVTIRSNTQQRQNLGAISGKARLPWQLPGDTGKKFIWFLIVLKLVYTRLRIPEGLMCRLYISFKYTSYYIYFTHILSSNSNFIGGGNNLISTIFCTTSSQYFQISSADFPSS